MHAAFEDVLVFVHVTGEHVGLVGFQEAVHALAVHGRGRNGRAVVPGPDMPRGVLRDMVEDRHGPAGFDQGQVLGEPVELVVGHVADVALAVPEHVVQHDVVHLAAVEGVVVGTEVAAERLDGPVVGRAEVEVVVADDLEEGHAHPLDAPLVLGVQGQVVEHDVPATHAEEPAVGQRGGGRLDVGHGLLVEEPHFVGVLGLGIRQDQESVALIGSIEFREVEAGGHLPRIVRSDRTVERGRAGWVLLNGVAVGRGDRYEGLARVGRQLETPIVVGGGDGQAVRDRDAAQACPAGQDAAGDADRAYAGRRGLPRGDLRLRRVGVRQHGKGGGHRRGREGRLLEKGPAGQGFAVDGTG